MKIVALNSGESSPPPRDLKDVERPYPGKDTPFVCLAIGWFLCAAGTQRLLFFRLTGPEARASSLHPCALTFLSESERRGSEITMPAV